MIMDTNLKNAIAAMLEEIAALEKEQKIVKPQRKTENFKGERTMSIWDATDTVRENKHRLRILYAAYGLLRGRNFDVTEKNAKPIDPGYYYTTFGWELSHLEGKHPLFIWINEIANVLKNYGYDFKNYEIKKDRWGYDYKTVKEDAYEEVVYIGE